ncbi:MAG: glycosyl hydrolase 2 galactose-binding domain-containing protein [Aeoliella sp.]
MHSIRLRGPWSYEVLSRLDGGSDLPPPGKQKMPADWSLTLGKDFHGVVRYRRTFHSPTGLEAGQGVWLVVEGVRSRAEVSLNDHQLAATCGLAAERSPIEHLLSQTNHLIIDVEHMPTDEGCGGLSGEVRLEIQTVLPRPVD